MRLRSWMVGLLVFIMIFGGIGVSMAVGAWQTESSKTPAQFVSGDFEGEYDPSDIRGSYSFGEVSQLFSIPLETLGEAFGVDGDGDLAQFQCKALEGIYEDAGGDEKDVGVDSVRWFTALYTGRPYEAEDTTWMPESAVEILEKMNTLKEEDLKKLQSRTLTPVGKEEAPITSNQGSVSEDSLDRMVKGKTLFREVLDWGLDQRKIEEIIGEAMPSPLTNIRDYCQEREIEFKSIKDQLQEALDQQ